MRDLHASGVGLAKGLRDAAIALAGVLPDRGSCSLLLSALWASGFGEAPAAAHAAALRFGATQCGGRLRSLPSGISSNQTEGLGALAAVVQAGIRQADPQAEARLIEFVKFRLPPLLEESGDLKGVVEALCDGMCTACLVAHITYA